MISIVNCSASDLYFINRVYNQTVSLGYVTADSTEKSESFRLEVFSKRNIKRNPIFMFYYDNRRIGWGSINSFYDREAYEKVAEISIYLEKENIGKGYAKECLGLLENKAKEYSYKTLLAYVFRENATSINLFEKFGYTKAGFYLELAKFRNLSTQDLIVLSKELD